MDTRTRGDIAEAAILNALTAHGFLVYTPFGRFGPCDLIAETATGELVRIQVKSGWVKNGVVEFKSCSTDHGRGPGSYVGRADVFAVHVHSTGEQYIVPVVDAPANRTYLRLTPTANNQAAKVRYARDYRLPDWVSRFTAPARAGDGGGRRGLVGAGPA